MSVNKKITGAVDPRSITLSTEEAKTRAMLQEHVFTKGPEEGWTNAKAAVANVFTALWYASLPFSRIKTVADALAGYEVAGIEEALTALTRAKVLRSKVHRGIRSYEMNY